MMRKLIGAQVRHFALDQMPVEAEKRAAKWLKRNPAKNFAMSAFGTKQTLAGALQMSAFDPKQTETSALQMSVVGGKADMAFCGANVCF